MVARTAHASASLHPLLCLLLRLAVATECSNRGKIAMTATPRMGIPAHQSAYPVLPLLSHTVPMAHSSAQRSWMNAAVVSLRGACDPPRPPPRRRSVGTASAMKERPTSARLASIRILPAWLPVVPVPARKTARVPSVAMNDARRGKTPRPVSAIVAALFPIAPRRLRVAVMRNHPQMTSAAPRGVAYWYARTFHRFLLLPSAATAASTRVSSVILLQKLMPCSADRMANATKTASAYISPRRLTPCLRSRRSAAMVWSMPMSSAIPPLPMGR